MIQPSWLNRGGADPRNKAESLESEMTEFFRRVCFGKEKRFKKHL